MGNDLLSQFNFPPEAQEFINDQNLNSKVLSRGGGGVAMEFEIAGHDRGMAIRFFTHEVENKVQSERFEMSIPDSIEMIEFIRDKKHKPVERVTMLPDQLLKFERQKFDKDGNKLPRQCVGGMYKEMYTNWKAGLSDPGLSLDRWQEASKADIFTLTAEGIFTVQQFAAMDRNRVESRFPPSLVELFNKAVRFTNSEHPVQDIKKYADQVLKLEQDNAKKDSQLAAFAARLEELEAKAAAPVEKKKGKKKPGRPCKTVEISEEE